MRCARAGWKWSVQASRLVVYAVLLLPGFAHVNWAQGGAALKGAAACAHLSGACRAEGSRRAGNRAL